jgi:hypothetical protein
MKQSISEQELAICRQMGVVINREGLNQVSLAEAKAKIMKLFNISEKEAARIMDEQKKKIAARTPLSLEEVKACRLLNVEPSEYYAAKCEEAGVDLSQG